jgi:CDP-diacylglycerol---serine O-phosphatidyltransferase
VKPRLGGAVYILPNLLTAGNLFFGFFSIIKCEQGNFAWAATAILIAMVFDVLDGRVARLTGGTSEFGVQFDSLSDLVSFGVAPAIILYHYGLDAMPRLGPSLCFLYVACAALRLARFNVQSSIGKTDGHFTGLPSPMAAMLVASFVLVQEDLTSVPEVFISLGLMNLIQHSWFKWTFLILAAPALGLAMVSNIVYRSHKALKFQAIKPFRLLVLLVLIITFAAYAPGVFLFSFALIYALSGLVDWLMGWQKATDEYDIFCPIPDDRSPMEPLSEREIARSLESEK